MHHDNKIVGKIKNLSLNEDTQQLDITITITDEKFKRKILRDLFLSGNILFEKDKIIFNESEE